MEKEANMRYKLERKREIVRVRKHKETDCRKSWRVTKKNREK